MARIKALIFLSIFFLFSSLIDASRVPGTRRSLLPNEGPVNEATANTNGTATNKTPINGTPANTNGTAANEGSVNGTAANANGTATNKIPINGTPTNANGTAANANRTAPNEGSVNGISANANGTAINKSPINGTATNANGTATNDDHVNGTAANANEGSVNGNAANANGTTIHKSPVNETPANANGTVTNKSPINGTAANANETTTNEGSVNGTVTNKNPVNGTTTDANGTATNDGHVNGTAANANGTTTNMSPVNGTAANEGPENETPANANGTVTNEGPTIFDVTKYGALADDKTDNIVAFRAAWGEACKNSTTQAKVLIPEGTFRAGQTMFAGPCNSPKPIIVEVMGTVKATTDVSEYPSPEWFTFYDIDGLLFTGKGVFDGQGPHFWPFNDCRQTKENCVSLPSALKLQKVNNSIVTDITSLNSMQFHFHVTRSSNLSFFNLNITAPGNSPNTDGMHISSSDRINVSSSVIGTGDDCISIGHSNSLIYITNITCGPGHGISIGSLGKRPEEKTVDGVTVTNCTFTKTTNGARIKTWIGTTPDQEATNIVYEDLIMNGVQNPIIIDQSYGSKKSRAPSNSVWKISDVHFRNIRGTTVSNVAVSLQCSTINPCEGIEVANVDLAYSGRPQNTTFVSSCLNAKAVFGGKLNPPAC
ncbi:hypothetical protein RJT34_22791 [Clitoria ternatea]|uniref:Uncharacterized protein n=1 Tax=Clitoria ternatea TaxID=43366 RepID=A0AAN9FLB7_CLITE